MESLPKITIEMMHPADIGRLNFFAKQAGRCAKTEPKFN